MKLRKNRAFVPAKKKEETIDQKAVDRLKDEYPKAAINIPEDNPTSLEATFIREDEKIKAVINPTETKVFVIGEDFAEEIDRNQCFFQEPEVAEFGQRAEELLGGTEKETQLEKDRDNPEL